MSASGTAAPGRARADAGDRPASESASASAAGASLASGPQCPLPLSDYPTVVLAHGGGGKLSRMLVEQLFLGAYANPALGELHDGAVLSLEEALAGARGTVVAGAAASQARLAFTTDSYVIDPHFFPGGDIGSLAVHGTVNDLAMCGARPLALSAGFILEEGFPMESLWRIALSMRDAAAAAGVSIVTGDTKVVDRGKGDGIFINTSGVGVIPDGVLVGPRRARPGDVILISGAIATHGVAILSVREGLEFESTLESDSAALHGLAGGLLDALGEGVHVLRDPTRGGVASALVEIAGSAGVGLRIDEASIPVLEEVRGACEILGLDPLYVANEGKMVAIVAPEVADRALELLWAHPLGRDAARIGEVVADNPGRVLQRSRIGGLRVVEMLSGEQLPRIC